MLSRLICSCSFDTVILRFKKWKNKFKGFTNNNHIKGKEKQFFVEIGNATEPTRRNVMKATGIVRRIDDLGRVVVPKEIRRTLRIREGDPMEIFTDREGEIILKKYSPIGELSLFAQQYADAVNHAIGHIVCICDKDQIIAAAGVPKRELVGMTVHHELEAAMDARQTILSKKNDKDFIAITTNRSEDFYAQAISTIICEGDAIGAVIILSRDPRASFTEAEKTQAVAGAYFLGRQMEN